MSSKRPRSSSSSSSLSTTSTTSPSLKLVKIIPHTIYSSLTCTLPPTCSIPHKPTHLTSVYDVEEHYGKYHTHVCEYDRCKRVFPDARFLELHFAECHDPITALKKERGEKTFACYLATCPRLFATPKGRRLHLIQFHGYPKQYFFAVTNKGIGGLLHKWGQGASLYRGEWKARSQDHDMKNANESEGESGSNSGSEMAVVEVDPQRQVNGKHRPPHMDLIGSPRSFPGPTASATLPRPHAHTSPESDTLANAMSSLSLVPDKIRFGRGGKKGGFAHPHLISGTKSDSSIPPAAPPEHTSRKAKRMHPGHSGGRGGRRRTQRKPSEGTSSTGGDADVALNI